MNTKTMTEGAPYKHILKFSIPVFLGALLQQLYNTVDTIVVGRFAGEMALAAVGTTGSITFLFLSIATGFSSGNGVLVAQNYGAKNDKGVKDTASTGISFLLSLGIILTIVGLLTSRAMYKYLVSVPDSLLDMTLTYFNIYALGLFFQYGYNIIAAILRSIGDSTATLYFLLISSVLNVILDVIFVANFNLGVAGAAIATDISQAISLIAAYIYMTKKYSIFRFKLSDYKFDKEIIKNTTIIGFPISLQLIVVSFGLTFIQKAVNEFGEIMTATFTVGQRIETYIGLPCNALQTTMATYTGQNIGAGKIDRVKLGAKQTIIISLIMTILISILLWFSSDKIVAIFGLGVDSTIYAVEFIRTVSIINIVLSTYIPLFGVFQGAGESGLPMIVACGALGMRVLVTYLFRYSSFLGYRIIWWNGIFGYGMGFLITWSFYLSGWWKKKLNI